MESHTQLPVSALFLFISVPFIPTTAGWGEGPITCKTHYYLDSQSAMLTCNYHKDLSQETEGFTITFCADDSRKDSCQKAISCDWKKHGGLFCVPTEQFKGMTCSVTDWSGTLTCQLPRACSDHSGSYYCQLVPSDERGQETCGLKVPETGTEPHQVKTTEPAMTSPSPTTEKCRCDDGSTRTDMILWLNFVTNLTILIFLGVILHILSQLLHIVRESTQTGSDDARSMMQK